MTTLTAEQATGRIQIKLQRLDGFDDQVRVSVVDEVIGAASGRSLCMTAEDAAEMVGRLYRRGRERGARISLEVATMPEAPAYAGLGALV